MKTNVNNKSVKMRRKIVVVVGILIRKDGQVLMAKRPIGKISSGFWEFPGGK